MKRINRIPLALAALLTAALACNLPQATPAVSEPNAAFTAAAQTVAAQLTQSALTLNAPTVTSIAPPLTTPPTNTTTAPTIAPPPTISPTLSPTATQICDKAQFVSDISIPDGTILTPGETFTKTWRIKNTGTCSWTPAYTVVFDHGDQMSGPSAQALVGNVNPGQSVDISVNLTAPAASGNYKGYWKLRNAAGVTFTNFYVDIKVSSPSVTVALPYMPGESGLVLSGGATNTLTVAAGDSLSDQGVEAFLSFDMSGIPAGSTIQTASLTLIGGGSVRGNPFGTLGCLRAYIHNYGAVDAGDFVAPGAGGAFAKWCSAGETGSAFSNATLVAALQGAVGSSRFQFRLQFKDMLTDGDGSIDDVLIIAPVTLTITYTAP
jgi:hypothetical protein